MVNEYLKHAQSPSHSPLCFRDLIKRAKHETIALNLNWAVKSDLNAQTNPFESTVETRLREQLTVQLQNYIHRIKITQKSDFSYGFWFFKQSRAMNRQANYELAKVLLEELTHEKPLNETFADIEQRRMHLIQLHRLNEKDNHGINSDELLKILTTARNHIQKQQQEQEVSRFCFW